jgi:histidinol-phosphate aminotransferase
VADSSRGIERLIRSHLTGFSSYSAAVSPETLAGKVDVPVSEIIKMDANENPYGCSPRVAKALAKHTDYNIYPDDGQQDLRVLLGQLAGASPDRIVAGGGSNQLIDLIVRLFINPGNEVINCVPTFDIYRFSTEILGGKMVNVTRDEKFNVNVKDIKSAITSKTKLIFIASPNNPTGNLIPQNDIVSLLEIGVPVVIDEAYYEFSGQTVVPLVNKYPNLIVLRTFSKWAGLAGLRVGYGIFPPAVANYIMAIKIPYNVNVAAIIAVKESLKDLDFLMDKVKAIITERSRLFEQLLEIKWLKPYPSQANFIFCSVLKGSAAELHMSLQKKGILIRYFDRPLLRNGIRVSVGKPEHTDALMKALRS